MTRGLFLTLHSGLPHEAPGSEEDTLHALALTERAGPLRVLDIACGPGAASATLLRALPQAHVTATDLLAPYLDEISARVTREGNADRFEAVQADMAALPFPSGAFDLLWCEGAAYIISVGEALRAWRRLLAPGGRLAFTEIVWLTQTPHPETAAFWSAYPSMQDLGRLRSVVAAAGWQVIGDFVLSERAWENYYSPLAHRCAAIERDHGPNPVLEETRREIALWRDHGTEYGYAFFVVEPA